MTNSQVIELWGGTDHYFEREPEPKHFDMVMGEVESRSSVRDSIFERAWLSGDEELFGVCKGRICNLATSK